MSHRCLLFLAGIAAVFGGVGEALGAEAPARIYLHKDWQIQSSCQAKASGAEISAAGFKAEGWHHSDIPSTVVGALVADKTYPDPNYGTNFTSFPGMHYSSKSFFTNKDTPKNS